MGMRRMRWGRRGPRLWCLVGLSALLAALAAFPATMGQAAPGAIVASTPATTPTASGSVGSGDAFASDQPIPQYQRGPDAWAWRGALPGARIVLYFGIVGAPSGGVIGWYGGDEGGLLNQLRNQAQAYAQVDPTHPVMMGLDVVDPLADAYPQAEGSYIDRMDPGLIQHYVDLTRQNHMLLFMDMQIERSTVQKELAYLWPYLQLPWVHLALDPEWDESHDGQSEGCGLGFDPNHTGRTYASEINYLIDQLAALVSARHLPPKTLIVHQYLIGENPAYDGYCGNAKPSEGWQNIHLKPGVNVVLNCDGVGSSLYGGPASKIADYDLFDRQQHIQYTGIKMYYYYPILTPNFYDDPIMTPQQVLSLNPPPLLIMYQ
jgi:hypothetical protein